MSGKILIVDDVATNRIVLKVKLAAACYDTVHTAGGANALRLARELQPDIILLEAQLRDLDGVEICRHLKADPATCSIPVVVVTTAENAAARMPALRAGAEDFLTKPLDEAVLLARLRSLLRAREAENELRLRDLACRDLGFAETCAPFERKGCVTLVAEPPETAARWKSELAPHLTEKLVIARPEETLGENLCGSCPDVFVVAADLRPAGAGLRLMSELRSRQATLHAAICMVVAPDARDTAAVALDLGASDIIPEGATVEEMALRIRRQIQRKRTQDSLRASVANGLRLAVTDPLTGLYNRRFALPQLAAIAERADVTGQTFAVMILDIDRFKIVNDTWGHAAGDSVLVEVAARLRTNLRSADLIARIGGEEFLIALPDCTLESARATAERIRRAVEEQPVRLPHLGSEIPVTLSIGLALGGGSRREPLAIEEVVGEADRALLGSKADGRNQVKIGRSAA
ncbi:diguanylate cyclase domain-containing protein [Ostreiculturibacter nitratireducens]|uniref:diguanylate cyclase domain-containing protein n=1 Tax=Ostreiculturibacter nitratireducens TaxID=3075226 RepID=UPI0031B62BB1